MLKKQCIQCNKEFEKPINCSLKDWQNRKFCSTQCKKSSQKGKAFYSPFGNSFRKGKYHSVKAKQKMSEAHLGVKRKPFTEEHKQKIREAQKGEKGYWFGKKHTEETKQKMSENSGQRFGEDNSNWKGDSIKIVSMHAWLEREFGKPQRCDNKDCSYPQNEVKRWDWALLHECEYERKRENFVRLCRSCHIRYDKKFVEIRL